jgi:hypothetical protein
VLRYRNNLVRTCQLLREDYIQIQNSDFESFQALNLS